MNSLSSLLVMKGYRMRYCSDLRSSIRVAGFLLLLGFVLVSDRPSWGGEVAQSPNPKLAEIPSQTIKVINEGYKGDKSVLAFSGMVYDHHRHKIMVFGGGHATANFPNSVHEFDLGTLQWSALTESVPPSEYSKENALFDKDGKALGGLKFKDAVWPASRHTYDGLVMTQDADLLIAVQRVGEIGAASKMPENGAIYNPCYVQGSGLWAFDPIKREWSVSKKSGLAFNHVGSAIWPKQPDWIYVYSMDGQFHAVNWRTEDVKSLPTLPKDAWLGFVGMAYDPGADVLILFPSGNKGAKNNVVYRFDLNKQTWTSSPVQGEAPDTKSTTAIYDERNKVFGCFSNRYFHYFDPRTDRWYKVNTQLDESLKKETLQYHHIYDPINNVHIAVTDKWTTFAFKLSDTPGKLSGTASQK